MSTLSYTLSLQDQMTAKLQKIGMSSDTAVNKFSALMEKAKESKKVFSDMGNSVGSLKQKLDLLRSEKEWIPSSQIQNIKKYNVEIQKLEKQINQLESTGGSKTRGMIADAFSNIPFAGFFTNPLVIAGAVAGKSLTLGIEAEMQKTSFEVLLGGENAAKGLIKDIAEYAKKTPYEKLGLGDAAKTMLGFGIAQEKVMPNLKAIGDIAMGDANKMNSLALAFSQTASAGKLNGQDLLQMINAGFNPLNQISKTTGISIGELKKQMEDGGISAKMVEDAFVGATSKGGQFYGMADKMSNTLGGRWSTFMDNINEKFVAMYAYIEPLASLMMDFVNNGIEAGANAMGWLISKFREGNPIVLALAGTILTVSAAMGIMKIASMAQATWTGIATIANNLQTASWWQLNAAMLANPITWIVAAIIGLIAVIGYVVYKTDGWGKMWGHTVKGAKLVFQTFVQGISAYWNTYIQGFMVGLNMIKLGWYKFKNAVGLGDSSENNKMIAQINTDTEARKKAVVDGYKKTAQLALQTKNEFQAGAGSLKWNSERKLSDMVGSLKKEVGISDPSMPGVPTNLKDPLADGKGKDKADKSNTATATGGTKHNYITIKIEELVGLRADTVSGGKETAKQAGEGIADELLRVLAMAGSATG
jgi:tape measure domain-containing protein